MSSGEEIESKHETEETTRKSKGTPRKSGRKDSLHVYIQTVAMHRNEWVENADRWVAGFLEMFEEGCHKMGTAIRDRIQERLRGQQSGNFKYLMQNGKGDEDDEDEEYYYDDDDYDDDEEEYYDDEDYYDEKHEKNEKEKKAEKEKK
ncbi:hypothetical protein QUC31_004021 [Theobroma cacao]